MHEAHRWDHSPTGKLKAVPGELWVEIKLKRSFFATVREQALLDDVIDLVHRRRIGVYTGRSSGAGSMDVTFDVKNRAAASLRLRELMLNEFSGHRFCVSVRFLGRFHDHTRKPPRSAQISEKRLNALIKRMQAEGSEACG